MLTCDYVNTTRRNGPFCPNCEGRSITFDTFDVVDNTDVFQGARCNTCNAEWHDHYELCGYVDLEVPEVAND